MVNVISSFLGSRAMWWQGAVAFGLHLALGGCSANVSAPKGADDDPSSPNDTAGTGGNMGAACRAPPAPRAPLRRLTRYDYNNTVQALLGIEGNPADALPGEELGNGFGNDADALGVSPVLVGGYASVAASIAESATA